MGEGVARPKIVDISHEDDRRYRSLGVRVGLTLRSVTYRCLGESCIDCSAHKQNGSIYGEDPSDTRLGTDV